MNDIAWRYITIHCSATPPIMDIEVDDIRRWHKEKGWSDIGYHFVIRRNGDVETGRALHITGAHVKNYNFRNIGICLVGGVDEYNDAEDNFTSSQKRALHRLVWLLCSKYGIDIHRNVLGHRDWPSVKKECPCFDVTEFFASTNQP